MNVLGLYKHLYFHLATTIYTELVYINGASASTTHDARGFDVHEHRSNSPFLPYSFCDRNILPHFLSTIERFLHFYQDEDFNARYMAIIDKILNNDIPFFLPSINDNNLRTMRAVIGTLANSSIPRVKVSSLCADWNIGAEKLYQLLFVMESVELIRIVRLKNDMKARSIGAKMLFADPCAYMVLEADLGTEREAFIANCFSQAGYSIFAMRDEKKGDYVVVRNNKETTIEVGGKNKKPKESDYVVRDNTDYPVGNAIPFWLIGMMW